VADASAVDIVVAEYSAVSSVDEFWGHLAAVLTDEVVIIEAQTVGMDWPELAEGLRRLVSTRAHLVKTAWVRGWLTADEARLFQRAEAREALAAAAPWIERAGLRSLAAAEPGATRQTGLAGA
jgi:hypothetical protein